MNYKSKTEEAIEVISTDEPIEVISMLEFKIDNTFESIYPLLTEAISKGIVQLEISSTGLCGDNYYNGRLRFTKSLKIHCYTIATSIDTILFNLEYALNFMYKV